MKDKSTGTIYFPHVIAGNKLNDKEYTFNSINGGMKPLADFNINQNKFLGGNSSPMIGLIKELGIYACPHFENRSKIVAFYVHDPETLTEEGRKVLERQYPEYKILYEKMTPTIHKVLTPEEIAKKRNLLEQIKDKGVNTALVDRASVDELEGVLQALDSGKSNLRVEQESLKVKSEDDVGVIHKRKTRTTSVKKV